MILTEALSDTKALRYAYTMFRMIVDDESLIKSITDILNNYDKLAEIDNNSDYEKDSLTVLKVYRHPLPCAIQFKLHKNFENKHTRGNCRYFGLGSRPIVTFFMTTDDGIFVGSDGEKLYDSYHKLTERVVKKIIEYYWDDVIVHELAHLYDYITIGRDFVYRANKDISYTAKAEREMKAAMSKDKKFKNDEKFFKYANDVVETNARVPQSFVVMANFMLMQRKENKPMPTFVQCLEAVLENMNMPYDAMVPDTRRRVIKRVHDMYSKLKKIFDSKDIELYDLDDVIFELNNL